MSVPEEDLLERARRLEEEALADLFDQYYLPLYRYLYQHVEHVETAQDLTGEVFQRLLTALHEGRGPRQYLKAWLFKVAHNLIVDEARRGRYRQHQLLTEALAADPGEPEEAAEINLLARQARAALKQLTPRQRLVIMLKYVEGLDNGEVAQAIGLPVGAVKALQHRALSALRRALIGTPSPAAEERAL